MNNKGQVLVVFVILLPIIFILLTLVIDMGFIYIDKRNIDNNTKDAVEYYLNNIESSNVENNIKVLLNKNIKDIDNIKINKTNNYVEVTVKKIRKSIYSVVTNNYEISITYKGLIASKEIIKG